MVRLMSRPHTRGSLYRDIYSAAITCGLDFRPKYWHEQTRRTRASPCFGGHFPWSVTFVCSQTLVYAFTFLPACLYLHALDWKMKFFYFIAHAVHLSSVADQVMEYESSWIQNTIHNSPALPALRLGWRKPRICYVFEGHFYIFLLSYMFPMNIKCSI